MAQTVSQARALFRREFLTVKNMEDYEKFLRQTLRIDNEESKSLYERITGSSLGTEELNIQETSKTEFSAEKKQEVKDQGTKRLGDFVSNEYKNSKYNFNLMFAESEQGESSVLIFGDINTKKLLMLILAAASKNEAFKESILFAAKLIAEEELKDNK
jgi:hypothetical protein